MAVIRPAVVARIADRHGSFGGRPLVDGSHLDAAWIDRDIGADVAADLQLHLGIVGLVNRDRQRCGPLPGKSIRVEMRDDRLFSYVFTVGFDTQGVVHPQLVRTPATWMSSR